MDHNVPWSLLKVFVDGLCPMAFVPLLCPMAFVPWSLFSLCSVFVPWSLFSLCPMVFVPLLCRVVLVETRQLLSLPYTGHLYRTFNPDLWSVLLATVVTKPLDICRVSISRNEWGIVLWVGH